MLFLLLFGSMLEPLIGGLALLLVYLGSGMTAAGSFLLVSGESLVPLVGASGAVSGVMALFCFTHWSVPVRYVYFLLIPKKGYAGYVFLPAWVILFLWLISDLAGYIASVNLLGGVAHIAHLAGEATGLLVGAGYYLLGYRQSQNSLFQKKISH
jgi:membrane associated rhomboid family serine protease